ncbi:MAG: hypothetical protein LBI03_08840 [Clostridiales bacterium]|jgi:hypothetical protein|nr:hypothetical protein [Clostridiales bacterium]
MAVFYLIFAVFFISDGFELLKSKSVKDMVIYCVITAGVLVGSLFYFANKDGPSFVTILLNLFNIKN